MALHSMARRICPRLSLSREPLRRMRSKLQALRSISAGLSMRLTPPIPQTPSLPSSFRITRTNSYNVSDYFERIKHGIPKSLPKMYAEFASREQAASFHCDYTIRAANVPSALTGQLHFVVIKTEHSVLTLVAPGMVLSFAILNSCRCQRNRQSPWSKSTSSDSATITRTGARSSTCKTFRRFTRE